VTFDQFCKVGPDLSERVTKKGDNARLTLSESVKLDKCASAVRQLTKKRFQSGGQNSQNDQSPSESTEQLQL